MNVLINYINSLSVVNSNITIFVSNLSQLKSPNLPISLVDVIKNKKFVSRIKFNKFTEINNVKSKYNSYINVKICLLSIKTLSAIELGSTLFNKYDYNSDKNITFIFSDYLKLKKRSICADIIFGFCLKSYIFNKYKTNNTISYDNISFNIFGIKEFKQLKYNLNLLESINFCKNLVSEPANILNPVSYSNYCLSLKKIGLKVKVLNFNDLQKIGMHSLLGVSQGSVNEPRVVIFEWNTKEHKKPTILVGKGVTFDSGGISLKPSSGMEEMIMDMGGSAVVVGCMMSAALNKSSKSIVGIIGLVENMPDGKAQRPGDIVKSLSGKTIEVLNTDAEGRLVLADILTYIQKKYNPKEIIDFATLTGAIMIALGTHRAGLFSNNDKLSKKLFNAGEITGEKLWRLPLGDEYDDEINTSRADMKNIGSSRYGGSIQAAQFIQRFINNDIPWAHLDIAGVTWSMKSGLNSFSKLHSPGATAFGVRLIDQFLKG